MTEIPEHLRKRAEAAKVKREGTDRTTLSIHSELPDLPGGWTWSVRRLGVSRLLELSATIAYTGHVEGVGLPYVVNGVLTSTIRMLREQADLLEIRLSAHEANRGVGDDR